VPRRRKYIPIPSLNRLLRHLPRFSPGSQAQSRNQVPRKRVARRNDKASSFSNGKVVSRNELSPHPMHARTLHFSRLSNAVGEPNAIWIVSESQSASRSPWRFLQLRCPVLLTCSQHECDETPCASHAQAIRRLFPSEPIIALPRVNWIPHAMPGKQSLSPHC
jgi:hypothetical protein